MTIKTTKTAASVTEFIAGKGGDTVQADAAELIGMMRAATGSEPAMWGSSIVGFGSRTYEASGTTNEWFEIGFSPRAGKFALYGLMDFDGAHELVASMDAVQTGKSCIYVRRMADVDREALGDLAAKAVEAWRAKNERTTS